MNSKKVAILSGAMISALVAGSYVFAEEQAAPAAGAATEQKAADHKDNCNGKDGCHGKKAHHGKHAKKKHEKKGEEAAPAGAAHE